MSIIFFLLYFLFLYTQKLTKALIITNIKSFITIIFPTIFTSLVLIDLFKEGKFFYSLSNKIFPFFHKLFHLKYNKSCQIILLSLLCGSPGNAKLINEAINNKEIDYIEGEKLIILTSTMSLSYVLTITSLICRNNIFNIIISYYLAHFVYFYITTMTYNKEKTRIYTNFNHTKLNIENTLLLSINNNMKIMINIFGIMSFATSLVSILSAIFPNFIYLSALIEINTAMNIDSINAFYVISCLSFLGTSMLFQIKGCFKDIKISYLIKNKLAITILANLFLQLLINIKLPTININLLIVFIFLLIIVFVFSFLFTFFSCKH